MATHTPGKKERPVDSMDGRNRIIREAARLFREKGFDRTTVRELAAATGMQSGSLFYFFTSKEEILLAVIDHGMKLLHAAVAEARAGATPEAGFRAMLLRHLEGILDRGADHMNVMLYETRSFQVATAEEVRQFRRDYDKLWEDQIEDLVRAGRWRETRDTRMARMALQGALNWSVQWFRPGRGDTYEGVAEVLCDLFLVPETPDR